MLDKIKKTTTGRDKKGFYHKDDKKYQSITTFLQKFPSDPKYLIKWALDNFNQFGEYLDTLNNLAAEGTQFHNEIEKTLKGGSGSTAVMNFLIKYSPKVISLEETVFDEDLMLAGRYDALLEIKGKKVLVDWKTSKQVQDKHKCQVAFYAKNSGADEAWVVCFGGNTKQKFSVSKVEIQNWYNKLEDLNNFFK